MFVTSTLWLLDLNADTARSQPFVLSEEHLKDTPHSLNSLVIEKHSSLFGRSIGAEEMILYSIKSEGKKLHSSRGHMCLFLKMACPFRMRRNNFNFYLFLIGLHNKPMQL
jgi:hypothetical protein